jgi:hypothetical protein
MVYEYTVKLSITLTEPWYRVPGLVEQRQRLKTAEKTMIRASGCPTGLACRHGNRNGVTRCTREVRCTCERRTLMSSELPQGASSRPPKCTSRGRRHGRPSTSTERPTSPLAGRRWFAVRSMRMMATKAARSSAVTVPTRSSH